MNKGRPGPHSRSAASDENPALDRLRVKPSWKTSDQRLAQALSYLLPKDREIVLLSYFAELTDGEVAQRVKVSRPTVQRRKNAALGKLRKMLEHNK